MRHEVSHFIQAANAGQIESSVNTHTLSKQVMAVLDEARSQLGVVYPADQ